MSNLCFRGFSVRVALQLSPVHFWYTWKPNAGYLFGVKKIIVKKVSGTAEVVKGNRFIHKVTLELYNCKYDKMLLCGCVFGQSSSVAEFSVQLSAVNIESLVKEGISGFGPEVYIEIYNVCAACCGW